MEYRYLGRSGLLVSELAMGTQTFGWGVDESTAHRMADTYTAAGGILFDTSSTYNEGESERILGSWLHASKRRDSVVVATKVFFATGAGPNDTGLSRKHIMGTAEASLERLRTDYIDLYQAHCYDLATPIDETLAAFESLVSSGKVRYLGVSNFTAGQLVRSVLTAESHSWQAPVALQAEYSLLVRETEWELLPTCEEMGIALLAWSPLAGGWLSGKYEKGRRAPSGSRVGRGDRWDDQPEQRESDRTWRIVETLKRIAEAWGKGPAQVALNYLLRKSRVVVPIFGARTEEQLADNLGSVGWELTPDDVTALDESSELTLPYPYRFIERYSRHRT